MKPEIQTRPPQNPPTARAERPDWRDRGPVFLRFYKELDSGISLFRKTRPLPPPTGLSENTPPREIDDE